MELLNEKFRIGLIFVILCLGVSCSHTSQGGGEQEELYKLTGESRERIYGALDRLLVKTENLEGLEMAPAMFSTL